MSEPVNPYAPPTTDPSAPGIEVPDGSLWRVEDGRLMVRDQVNLPDLCILGGPVGGGGVRSGFKMRALRSWRRSGEEIEFTAMISDEMIKNLRKRRLQRMLGIPLLLLLSIGGIWVMFPGSKDTLVPLLSFVVIASVTVYDAFTGLRISSEGDGWYLVKNVSPRFLAELSRLGMDLEKERIARSSPPSRQAGGKPQGETRE